MDIDFHDPAVIADPFPYYEDVRAEGRVVWNGLMGLWMVPGYQDNADLMMDWRRFSNTVLQDPSFAAFAAGNSMLNTDPPEATRLRRMLEDPFRRKSLSHLEGRVREIVDSFLDPFAEKLLDGERVDFVQDFVRGIPTMVICDLLGVPVEHRLDVQGWTDDMTAGLGAARDPNGKDKFDKSIAAAQSMNAMFLEERERRKRAPADDVLSSLSADDSGLTDGEFLAACQLLLTAGNETTYKLISNAVVLLANHPDQRRLLVEDPSLVTLAVEETLRFEGVPQAFPRVVTEDVVFAGVPLTPGDHTICLIVAANRDPARFEHPQRYDVRRSPNPHMAFAHGTHLCLGQNLARMEAQIALSRLLARVPDWEVTDVDYGASFHVRGPQHLGFLGRPVVASV